MHEKFLKHLCCPKTGLPLKLTCGEVRNTGFIISGALSTDTDSYPIVNGIPRFVESELYSDSFGFEWTRFPELQFDSNNLEGPFTGYTRSMFSECTGHGFDDLKDRTAVEFGCGPGRFLYEVKQRGGLAVGIDLSLAVESARKNFPEDPDVLIVQGDLLNPPFAEESFDAGYSIGVLHHTPAPCKGAHALAQTIRPGGHVAVCVYDKAGFYDYPSTFWYRKLFTFIRRKFGAGLSNKLALGYAYAAAYPFYYLVRLIQHIPLAGPTIAAVIRQFFLSVCDLPDGKWRVLDTFDGITPEFASTHDPEEVEFWLTSSGCGDVTQQTWGATAFAGAKIGKGK